MAGTVDLTRLTDSELTQRVANLRTNCNSMATSLRCGGRRGVTQDGLDAMRTSLAQTLAELDSRGLAAGAL